MNLFRILSIVLAAACAVPAGGLSASAQTSGCFCAKVPPPTRKCGEVLTMTDETIRIQEADGHKLTLDPQEYAGCSEGPGASAARPEAPSAAPLEEPGQSRAPLPPPSRTAYNRVTPPPPGTPLLRSESFGIAGSNTIGERLVPELIGAWASRNGWTVRWPAGQKHCAGEILLTASNGQKLAIRCSAHGSKDAFPQLFARSADIGMKSSPADGGEKTLFPYAMDTPPQENVLALDGLLILTAAGNPVNGLTLDEAARIFSGEITDWRQVGGTPGRINLYVRDRKSGTRETFDHLVMQPVKREIAATAQERESSEELVADVARDANGVGFVGFAYGSKSVKALKIRETCGIVHEPSLFGIKTEDYPLARRLFLYRPKGARSLFSREFADYAVSEEAQPVIAAAGYVDQRIESGSAEATFRRVAGRLAAPVREAGLEGDPVLMRDLAAAARRARRLSITFRFRVNSGQLDTKAWQDAVRFAGLLQRKAPEAKVLLLGFADAQGPWAHNLSLSQQRAETVRSALLNSGAGLRGDNLLAKGFGELLPVSCNADQAGRTKNRRVEVWLLDPGAVNVPSSGRGRL